MTRIDERVVGALRQRLGDVRRPDPPIWACYVATMDRPHRADPASLAAAVKVAYLESMG
jgi:hypothetical protein